MKSFAMNVKKCFVLYLFSFIAFRVPQSLSQLGCRKMYDTSNQSKCNMNAALVIEREEDCLPELTKLTVSVYFKVSWPNSVFLHKIAKIGYVNYLFKY